MGFEWPCNTYSVGPHPAVPRHCLRGRTITSTVVAARVPIVLHKHGAGAVVAAQKKDLHLPEQGSSLVASDGSCSVVGREASAQEEARQLAGPSIAEGASVEAALMRLERMCSSFNGLACANSDDALYLGASGGPRRREGHRGPDNTWSAHAMADQLQGLASSCLKAAQYGHLTAAAFASLAADLSILGYRDPVFWGGLLKQAEHCLPSFTPRQVVIVLAAATAATGCHVSRGWLLAAEQQVAPAHMADLGLDMVSSLMQSMGRLGFCPSTATWAAALAYTHDAMGLHASRPVPRQYLEAMLEGVAACGGPYPGRAWLGAWCTAYQPHLGAGPTHSAARTLYLLAAMQHVPPEAFEQAALQRIDACLDAWLAALPMSDPPLQHWLGTAGTVVGSGSEPGAGPEAAIAAGTGATTAAASRHGVEADANAAAPGAGSTGEVTTLSSRAWNDPAPHMGALELGQLVWAAGAFSAACPSGFTRIPSAKATAQLKARRTLCRAIAAGVVATAALAGFTAGGQAAAEHSPDTQPPRAAAAGAAGTAAAFQKPAPQAIAARHPSNKQFSSRRTYQLQPEPHPQPGRVLAAAAVLSDLLWGAAAARLTLPSNSWLLQGLADGLDAGAWGLNNRR